MTEPREPKPEDQSDSAESQDVDAADVAESDAAVGGSQSEPGDSADLASQSVDDRSAQEAATTATEAASEDAPAAPAMTEPVAAKTKGSVIGWLAFVLALVAVGGTGYLYYRAYYDNPLDDVTAQLNSVAAEQNSVATDITDQLDSVRAKLSSDLAKAEQRRAESESALVASLNEAITAGPPTEDRWKIAEVEYLLRIANHRALMERDAKTALQLLSTADAILTELDDFALHPVRAALADEMLALKSRGVSDRQGLFLRLDALKGSLERLPLRVPDYFAPEPVAEEEAQSPWQVLVAQLSGYFKFRKLSGDEAAKPLLSPDEGAYLEMNLRLMIERAQLALLREDAVVFSHSIEDARGWIEQYLDPSDPAVVAVTSDLEELAKVQLDAPIPDISSSLRTLESLRGAIQ